MRATLASAAATRRTVRHSSPSDTGRRPSSSGTVRRRTPALSRASKAPVGKAGKRSRSPAPAATSAIACSKGGLAVFAALTATRAL